MACLLALFALITPRIVILLVLIFSNYLESAYQTFLWPLLGFLFMPLTTLAYAFAINEGGHLHGLYLVIFIVAILFDAGSIGGGSAASSKRR